MCVGGGGGGGSVQAAKINAPSQAEYDEVTKVVEGIAADVRGLLSSKDPLNKAYDLLQSSNEGLRKAMVQAESLSMKAANSQALLAADAARLAMLRGAPPPDKAAEAPLVGSLRGPRRSTLELGRRSLRIDLRR